MTWRDDYNQPSFRGVPFHVDSTDESGGRRLATHEYPQRDIPYHEDMGRAAQAVSFDAYVSGPNYHVDRDALKAALNEAGPGELVHPYHGVLQVHVSSYTLRESTADGGVARFSLSFLPAGEARYPSARANTKTGARAAADVLRSTSRSSFLSRFDSTGPGFVREGARSELSGVTDTIDAAFTVVTGNPADGADYLVRLASIRNSLAALVIAPEDLADELSGLFTAASQIGGGPRRASRSHLAAYDSTRQTLATGTTPAREQQAANTNALNGYARALALAAASEQAVTAAYATFDEAVETQASLLERMDTETELVADDDVFLALEELRAAVAAAVPDPAAALPQLVTYTPAVAEPSLLAAQRLYGDAGRGDEIVSRNQIKHPLFLPGGRALRVLSSG